MTFYLDEDTSTVEALIGNMAVLVAEEYMKGVLFAAFEKDISGEDLS